MMMRVYCPEPKQGKIREVRSLDRSLDNVLKIHERMLTVPNFLDTNDDLMGLDTFLVPTSDFVEVDDVGVVALDMIEDGRGARIHCTFWDGRLRGREYLCRRVMEELAHKHELKFVYCVLEPSRVMLVKFCERVGMKVLYDLEDGRLVLVWFDPHYLHRVNSPQGGSSWVA